MRSLLTNKAFRNTCASIQTLLFCLFAATLCLNSSLNHGFLIGGLFFSLLLADPAQLKKSLVPVLLLGLVYIVAGISALYSPHTAEAAFVLEKQMTLLIIPLVLGAAAPAGHRQLRLILWSFVASLFAVCLYLLGRFYISYEVARAQLSFQDFLNTQLHHNFSASLHLHATYLSMYVCFAIAIALYMLFYEKKYYRLLMLLFLPVFVISLVLLSSRIIFIPFAVIVFFILPFFLKKKPFLIYLAVLITLLPLLFYYLSGFPAFRDRFKTDTLRELNIRQSGRSYSFLSITETNDATRAERWKCAVELIRERPVAGYGTGEEKAMLSEMYTRYGLSNSLLNNFDAHNQYLGFMIRSGLFGLCAYLILLAYSLYAAIRKRNYIHICLLLILAITSLTENVLDSNKGIVFFAFFNTLLVFSERAFLKKETNPAGKL